MISAAQSNILQIICSLSSSLSIVACIIVLSRFFGKTHVVKTLKNKQFRYLCSIDLITSCVWVIGNAAEANFHLCQFQAFIIQWGALANVFWNMEMAHQLYKWMVLKKNEERIMKRTNKFIKGDCYRCLRIILILDIICQVFFLAHYSFRLVYLSLVTMMARKLGVG